MQPLTTTSREKYSVHNHNASTPQSVTSSIVIPREIQVSSVLFTLRWRLMTQILLALPVLGLFVCLISSLIFHADHINNTICEVYNFLPSISAVTGVSPQRYLWRTCVALHISPRLLVAWVAKEFYTNMATRVPAVHRPFYRGLVSLAFCLNLIELATLCGVTYISNKENYPVHEKLFMIFMMSSLVYMVCVVRLLNTVRHALSPLLLRSLSHKRWLLGTKIGATLGLLFFFWRHRVHCQPKAFSWFSLCEYVIATCNMLYHVSVALDFSEEHLIVGHIVTSTTPHSVTTPESSLLSSSFTINSIANEFSNAIDKTPEAEYLLDDDHPLKTSSKECYVEKRPRDFERVGPEKKTEENIKRMTIRISPIKRPLQPFHQSLSEEKSNTKQKTYELSEISEHAGHSVVNSNEHELRSSTKERRQNSSTSNKNENMLPEEGQEAGTLSLEQRQTKDVIHKNSPKNHQHSE